MTRNESSRIMLELRSKGWSDTEIVNFVLRVETGDSQDKPKQNEAKSEYSE